MRARSYAMGHHSNLPYRMWHPLLHLMHRWGDNRSFAELRQAQFPVSASARRSMWVSAELASLAISMWSSSVETWSDFASCFFFSPIGPFLRSNFFNFASLSAVFYLLILGISSSPAFSFPACSSTSFRLWASTMAIISRSRRLMTASKGVPASFSPSGPTSMISPQIDRSFGERPSSSFAHVLKGGHSNAPSDPKHNSRFDVGHSHAGHISFTLGTSNGPNVGYQSGRRHWHIGFRRSHPT